MKVWDEKGNEFTIVGGSGNMLELQGKNGKRQVSAKGLLKYSSHSPEVSEAINYIVHKLKTGELSVEALRKLREGTK